MSLYPPSRVYVTDYTTTGEGDSTGPEFPGSPGCQGDLPCTGEEEHARKVGPILEINDSWSHCWLQFY